MPIAKNTRLCELPRPPGPETVCSAPGEPELELDLGSGAGPRAEANPSRQGAGRAVLPQRCRGQDADAVLARAPDESLGEPYANPVAVQLVGHLDGDICRIHSLGPSHVSSHADDRAVSTVDRRERLVTAVIDLGEVAEFALAQLRLAGDCYWLCDLDLSWDGRST